MSGLDNLVYTIYILVYTEKDHDFLCEGPGNRQGSSEACKA